VGMDHTMPRKAFASGGKNMTDEARCLRVDVAVGSDKPHGNRADTPQDQFCWRIQSVAVHPVASLPRHIWSGRRDLNPRPPGPQPGALPSYATPRRGCKFYRREAIAAVPHFRAPYAANPRCVDAKPDSRSTPAKGDSMTPIPSTRCTSTFPEVIATPIRARTWSGLTSPFVRRDLPPLSRYRTSSPASRTQ